MNYATLIDKIMHIAIAQEGINYTFEGDIYAINSLPATKYPVFVVATTQPHVELENYFRYNLTFYYIDRTQFSNNEQYNPDTALIQSAGMGVLSNIIRKLRHDPEIMDIDSEINYTFFSDSEIFSDRTAGVYTTISIYVDKETNCVA